MKHETEYTDEEHAAWEARADELGVSEVSSTGVLSFEDFWHKAVELNLTQQAACEDPAGYDDHRTLNRLFELYEYVLDNAELSNPDKEKE